MNADDMREKARQAGRRMAWPAMSRKAKLAAQRAQRMAREGAQSIRQAAAGQAERFRHRGRRDASQDLAVQRMAGLPATLQERSITSTLERKKGPEADPAWLAGYRDVVKVEAPGYVEAGPRRPVWPERVDPDLEAAG